MTVSATYVVWNVYKVTIYSFSVIYLLRVLGLPECKYSYYYYYAPAPRVGGIKRWCASDVCLSRTSGLSREEERLRKTKIGIEVAHVTRDSDTTFKVKRSKVNLQGAGHIVAASRIACYFWHWRGASAYTLLVEYTYHIPLIVYLSPPPTLREFHLEFCNGGSAQN